MNAQAVWRLLKAAFKRQHIEQQTIAMNDAQVALSYYAQDDYTEITSPILVVDAESSATEDLLLPAEDENAGPLLILNNGGESIVVKDDSDSSTIATLASGDMGIFLCDGTTWYATVGGGSVDSADIADDAVTAAKALAFVSAEQTGTGSPQNVAHGLGAAPSLVLVAPTEADGNAWDIAEGTHTTTNVVITATSGLKFKVFAWA